MSNLSFFDRSKQFAWNLPRHLSPGARITAIALFSYAHDDGMGIYVGVENLMKFTCLCRRSQFRALEELIKAGYLEGDGFQHHKSGAKTRRRRLNMDLMAEVRTAEDTMLAAKKGARNGTVEKDADIEDGTHHSATSGAITVPNQALEPKRGTEEKEPKEIPNGISHVRACEAMFLAFWSLYPRKEGSRAARRAWEEVTREYNPADILTALGRHEFAIDPQYIPMAVKWLRDGRFLDQPDGGFSP